MTKLGRVSKLGHTTIMGVIPDPFYNSRNSYGPDGVVVDEGAVLHQELLAERDLQVRNYFL